MYFYLLLFFSKAIFWGEDWDPQKMLGTPIWSDMWVPGPRMKNPSAIPAYVFYDSFITPDGGTAVYSPLNYLPGYPYCSDRNGIEITMLRFVLLPHITIIL